METYEPVVAEWTYTVKMIQHIKERKNVLMFEDDIRATSEEEAIALMKDELWAGGFDNDEISVMSAQRVINWN